MNSGDKIIIISYISSVIVSLGNNLYLSEKSFLEARKESMRKLKYRKGLSAETKKILFEPIEENIMNNADIILHSLIPVYNVFYSMNSKEFYDTIKQMDLEYQNDIVAYANDLEDYIRFRNVTILRNLRDKLKYCPDALNKKLDDENSTFTDGQFKLIMRLNGLNYKDEIHKYNKENNGEDDKEC